ncbi:YegP family protein [Zophobihabitans entericus]|uniref:YegP family protein n=1 Tax=Zophobihabitans entericus TaxID=1635327 RepID=A0A6G9ICK2_9GAMM|nr:YegP family protein [Zophobihabitans entericus]QIQ21961.1 YegP family protein [Zophobihabitans entericus]
MSGKFEVFKSPKNNQFYFRLKASNGQVILQSEGYTTKDNCKKGVLSVKKNSQFDKAFDKKPKHFNLKSVDNGQVIGTSEQYTSEKARDEGIESVKKNAPTAEMIDLTKVKK